MNYWEIKTVTSSLVQYFLIVFCFYPYNAFEFFSTLRDYLQPLTNSNQWELEDKKKT